MNIQRLPLDIISNLPSSIIQTLLTFMPIRDAFRTSILSRKWRYHCANMLKLEFNDQVWESQSPDKYKLLLDIYTVLLLHHCPVLEFSLCISQLESCCEIDQIILYLSRNTNLEKFTLRLRSGSSHRLPSTLWSLRNLTHLKLERCELGSLETFSGFDRLTDLCFYDVIVAKNTLLRFLICCPRIKNFTMIKDDMLFSLGRSLNFVDLLQCLPSVERLQMGPCPIKLFGVGKPTTLGLFGFTKPKAVVHLNFLRLFGLSFANEDELRSVLLLVSNSPNVKKIKLEMSSYYAMDDVSQAAKDFFDLLDYSDVSLEHLHELEIIKFTGIKPEMDFVKLILARSPMLEKVRLEFGSKIDFEERFGTLEKLLEFRRASSRAKIVFGK